MGLDNVSFYATNRAEADSLRAALHNFSRKLPTEDHLQLLF